jgi:SulP family sulfate permease
MESRVADHSALEALFQLVEKYEAAGKEIHIQHLSEECQELMIKASPKLAGVIERSVDDPRYHVMSKVMG